MATDLYKRALTDKKHFKDKYRVDIHTKCWNWIPSQFRYRTGEVTHNPRRYAAQINGFTLPPGRNIYPECQNPRCVNPEHSRMSDNGLRLDPNQPLLLRLSDLYYSDNYLSRMYVRSREDIAEARLATKKMVITIKQSRATVSHLAGKYGIAPSYVRTIRKLTLDEWNMLKQDPNVEDIEDEDIPSEEAMQFTL